MLKLFKKKEKMSKSFGKAIQALKDGKRVARASWNGKNMFIFMQVPCEIDLKIVPNMQSLPQSVKDAFMRRQTRGKSDPWNTIKYKNQLAIVYPDNTIFGWVASPSDVLEDDWLILD